MVYLSTLTQGDHSAGQSQGVGRAAKQQGTAYPRYEKFTPNRDRY